MIPGGCLIHKTVVFLRGGGEPSALICGGYPFVVTFDALGSVPDGVCEMFFSERLQSDPDGVMLEDQVTVGEMHLVFDTVCVLDKAVPLCAPLRRECLDRIHDSMEQRHVYCRFWKGRHVEIFTQKLAFLTSSAAKGLQPEPNVLRDVRG